MTTLARFTNVGELQLPTGEIVEGHPTANPIEYVPDAVTNAVPNPNAANGLSGILVVGQTSANQSVARVTSLPSGTNFTTGVLFTVTVAGDSNATWIQLGGTNESTQGIPVIGGATYTFSVWFYSASGGMACGIRPIEWNSSGGLVSDDGSGNTTVAETRGGWQRLVRTVTLNASTAYVSYRINTGSTGTGYLTGAMIESGTQLHPFIQGTVGAGSVLVAGELQETGIENPMSLAPTATTNLLTDPSTLANHTLSNGGGIATYSAVLANGVYHITYTKNGQGDYRVYSEPVYINKALAYVFSYDIKVIQTAQTYDFFLAGGAISTSQEVYQEMQFAQWQGNQWVATPPTGTSVEFEILSDGYTRIYVIVPANWFQGTTNDIKVAVYGNWAETASTYEFYYRRPQIEQATQPSIWSSDPSSHTRPAGSIILQRELQEAAKNAVSVSGVTSAGYVWIPASALFTVPQFTFMGRYKWDGVRGASSVGLDWASFFAIPSYGGAYGALFNRNSTVNTNAVNFYVNGVATSYTYTEDTNEHHWAFVYNGTNEAFIYRDGVLVATGSVSTPPSNTSQDLYIGSNAGAGYPWGGTFKEASLWNRALSQAEVQAFMEAVELYGNESGLVGYWPLNENAGSTINDRGLYGHNGSLYGTYSRIFV